MSEYQFKVGDRVRIWDKHEEDHVVTCGYVGEMLDCAGMEATIVEILWDDENVFVLDIDCCNVFGLPFIWSAPMLSLMTSLPETSMSDLETVNSHKKNTCSAGSDLDERI